MTLSDIIKFKLFGGGGGFNVVELTQSEYDSLPVYQKEDPAIFYAIIGE